MKFGNEIPISSENSDLPEEVETQFEEQNFGKWQEKIEISDDIGEWQDSIPLTEDMLLDNDKVLLSETNNINNSNVENSKKIRCPENNGEWSGERGNSTWHPDPDYVPPEKCPPPKKPYSNPDNLSSKEILEKYNIDGIEFKDGYPIFNDISKGTIEIEDFETGGEEAKKHNFAKAYRALAEQRGCTPQEVKEWMKENNYTWHECEDKKTMQKVPNEIHANVPHDGGRRQYKEGE